MACGSFWQELCYVGKQGLYHEFVDHILYLSVKNDHEDDKEKTSYQIIKCCEMLRGDNGGNLLLPLFSN